MNKKELEAQAKEFNVSVEQIKEWRKHIKPFLRFAIKNIKHWIAINASMFTRDGFCWLISDYGDKVKDLKLKKYLLKRLNHAKPKDIDAYCAYWYPLNDMGLTQRINFCKQQLKLVKP